MPAVISARSQVSDALTGDHDRRLAPAGMGSLAEGSNSQTSPTSARPAIVARITSGFVDVLTTAPEAAISAGIITALVFPLRGGPRIITALSGSAATHSPYSFAPRYAPPPTRRRPSRTRAAGLTGLRATDPPAATGARGSGRARVREVRVRTSTPSVSAPRSSTRAITAPIAHANTLPEPPPSTARKDKPTQNTNTSANNPPRHDANGCERLNGGSRCW